LLASVLLSYALAVGINSFFEGILGEKTQAELEAPFAEELLKPLGLIILAIALPRAKRIGRAGVGWLKSIKACYAIGYASGLVFGVLENWLSYDRFSGFRAATPFLHALGTGIVGVGIYYVLTRGKRGLGRFAFLYSVAFSFHFAWNNIESPVALAVLGASETVIGLAAFLFPILTGLRMMPSGGEIRRNHGQ
jgi:RsiW-degrading membrane proteinase PrsW (M82 family)